MRLSFVFLFLVSWRLLAWPCQHLIYQVPDKAQVHLNPRVSRRPLNVWVFRQELQRLVADGASLGLKLETLGLVEGQPTHRVVAPSPNPKALKILLVAGIHGNEPMGVVTAFDLLRRFIEDKDFREDYSFEIYPDINPWGLAQGLRRNIYTVDVNRTFSETGRSQSSKLLISELQGRKFDVVLDLHGARFREGMFVIVSDPKDKIPYRAIADVPEELRLATENGQYPSRFDKRYFSWAPGVVTSAKSRSRNAPAPRTFRSWADAHLGAKYVYTVEYAGRFSSEEQFRWNTRLLYSLLREVSSAEAD